MYNSSCHVLQKKNPCTRGMNVSNPPFVINKVIYLLDLGERNEKFNETETTLVM